MTIAQEVVRYAQSLVGQKVTVPTNPYGGQCVALTDHVVQRLSGGKYNLAYTNAKDCLTKAKNQGLAVFYKQAGAIPEAGDFFVCKWSDTDPFGHIGIVVSADSRGMVTIEQNIDGYRDDNHNGINDQLEVGGGGYTRNHSRNYEGVIGWFRLPYDAPQIQATIEQGEHQMSFTFHIKGDKAWNENAIYFYNGNTNEIRGLAHPDELTILKQVFKDANGRELPHYEWTNKAPWYVRFFRAVNPNSTNNLIQEAIKISKETAKKLEEELKSGK